MKPLKNLYEWVLSWAESVYGTLILFLVAFAESSFFPVPADPLLMALCLGKVKKSMYYVFICLLYTSPSPRDKRQSRMPSSA